MKPKAIARIEKRVGSTRSWSYSLPPYCAVLTYDGTWLAEYFKKEEANPFFTSAHELHPNLKLRSNQFVGADRAVRRVLRSLEQGWSVTQTQETL